ncbi:MAG: DUF3179 domain-containing protein [Planctomycetota bacterium]
MADSPRVSRRFTAVLAVALFGIATGVLGYRVGVMHGASSAYYGDAAIVPVAQRSDSSAQLSDVTVGHDGWIEVEAIIAAASSTQPRVIDRALAAIEDDWRDGYAPILIELARFTPSQSLRDRVIAPVARRLGTTPADRLDKHWRAVWAREFEPHPDYAEFKATLYRRLDPSFERYFDDSPTHTIRLDEIRWGGVRRDGIPPLVDPEMVSAGDPAAGYLSDDHVVFGVVIDGDARAYPKRILAWHEMFRDTIGGRRVAGVYCTLCGTVIAYDATHDGKTYEFGTSGFLYRSNKLMYDPDTFSMWSTFGGTPVVGPLVGQGIELDIHPVVTTTWGQWKADHPDTRVMTLATGHRRDYAEGAAYRAYFATDELMFGVPAAAGDDRLLNKAEVFVLRGGGPGAQPLAIAVDTLAAEPVFAVRHAGRDVVVLTDASGANRAYGSNELKIVSYNAASRTATDAAGRVWAVTEDALVATDGQESRDRLPAHRAFWFGFHAAFPDAELIE